MRLQNKWLLIFVGILLWNANLFAQTGLENVMMKSFPMLDSLQLETIRITLFYSPALSQVLTEPHPHEKEFFEAGVYVARPLRAQLLGPGNGDFIIDCDSGGSWDQQCTVYQERPGDGLKLLLSIPGLRFAFPGDSAIYVDGHNNTMFNLRKKFVWQDSTFIEAAQPFHYVGLETTTREAVTLYADAGYKSAVEKLPAGSSVTVLLNEGENYLLKTPFGLVGWIRIPDCLQEKSSIYGLYYHGD